MIHIVHAGGKDRVHRHKGAVIGRVGHHTHHEGKVIVGGGVFPHIQLQLQGVDGMLLHVNLRKDGVLRGKCRCRGGVETQRVGAGSGIRGGVVHVRRTTVGVGGTVDVMPANRKVVQRGGCCTDTVSAVKVLAERKLCQRIALRGETLEEI